VARPIPDDRLSRLVEVATGVFIDQGFRHTRMDDVAEAVGVAKGTLYLYVESKEALFDLVCRSADQPFEPPKDLPVKSPPPGSTTQYIAGRLAGGQVMPALADALGGRKRDIGGELTAVVGDIYDALARNRVGIKLVDRSARDIPELGQLWFGGARTFLVDALVHYLTDRARTGRLRAPTDTGVAARFIVETCAFWAVHRHWDVGRPEVAEERIRAAVIDLVKAALVTPAASSTDTTRTTRTKGKKR
jgi:AcrR family transcriptional regulator